MPRTQEGLARLIDRERLRNPGIAEAFRSVDRADFVPVQHRLGAYRDRPIGIPNQQTTSQPSLIARMIDVAEIDPGDRVLEVGTGYGFQTALLGRVAGNVVSIELHPRLARVAEENLQAAGINNVSVVVGDGWAGHQEAAPYAAVIVSAAASELPAALVEQLAEGGRLVIPLRERGGDNVYLFRKKPTGITRDLLVTPARFVPLVRS